MQIISRARTAYTCAIVTPFALLLALVAFRTSDLDAPLVIALVLPVGLIAYLDRLGPSIVAVVASVAAGLLYLTSPIGEPGLTPEDMFRLASLVIGGVTTVVIVHQLHRMRRRAETAHEKTVRADERFRLAFHKNPSPMAMSRIDDRRVVDVNDAYIRTFDFGRREDIVGQTPLDAGLIADPARSHEILARIAADGAVSSEELDVRTLADRVKTVLLSAQKVDLDGVPHLLSTFIDITDRKSAEEKALVSEQRFREIADTIDQVFWMTTPTQDQLLYVSPAYERVWGRTCASLYARPSDWMIAIHADDRECVNDAIARPEEAHVIEFRIIRDRAVRWLRSRAFPVRDSHGAVTRIVGVTDDITDHHELEAQLLQTQKLESLGLLAGGVAHDFNNILAVIAANIGMLGEVVPNDNPDHELVDEIDDAVRRATALTRQLLAFSRKEVIEPVVLDLNIVVADTRKMLRRMLGEDVVLTTSLEPDLARIRIDPGCLVQVIMNLAVNARDAMPRGGALALATRSVVRDGQPQVMLEIADTGCGMPGEVMEHVFEPFFTTKGIGKGTGLGLSVVHGIVKQAGGRIEIDSRVGFGTTFRIYVPSIDEPAERIENIVAAIARGCEKVLVVDDDLHVRMSTSRTLRTRGYTVFEADGGAKALRVLHDHVGEIDLVITDIVMPEMDGRELAEAVRALSPGVKILFTSGYTDDAIMRHGVIQSEIAFLEKPFRMHTLASKVRQILDDVSSCPKARRRATSLQSVS